MAINTRINADVLPWLLEPENPGVRYLALRDVVQLPAEDADLVAARAAAHQHGPIAHILDKMQPEGYWSAPGPGYSPKYRSTVWAVTLLAQLGANLKADERIFQACNYVMEYALTSEGHFSHDGTPSGTFDCLQGNLSWALIELGCRDARLYTAFEWMARSQTGEGIAPASDRHAETRYYSAKCGPNFACGANNKKPCAWGAIKVMLAFGALPSEQRTPIMQRAMQRGVDFLLGTDPAGADYPVWDDGNPSSNWWKFGFPVFYITDLLQNVEALVKLGYGADPRLANALALIRDKQDADGRWALDYDYAGKTWGNYGKKHEPNKWVTLRAVRVLQAAA